MYNVKKFLVLLFTLYARSTEYSIIYCRLNDYFARKRGVDALTADYPSRSDILGELTKFEKKLLETQDVFDTRGKVKLICLSLHSRNAPATQPGIQRAGLGNRHKSAH